MALKIEKLSKAFGDLVAVNDVSFDVPAGQMIGIIGRSGAGKSTLLRMINRLADPTSGRILVEGVFDAPVDVAKLKGKRLRQWRAQCAMVFQQFNLVPRLTVMTNVLMARISYHPTLRSLLLLFTPKDRAFTIRALQRLDMVSHALHRADELSGGQQQRVAIARALVQEPKILLADEPIASLDLRNATIVMDALRRINREDGITVICNLHLLQTAKDYCDRIIGMRKGEIVFDGKPSDLSDAMAREIYGVGEHGAGEPADDDVELAFTATQTSTSAAAEPGHEKVAKVG
ncbi:MAG: phosphonate ABC transporter ATP-binding protein [Betaproteobacteria bacterium]|nr:phosphonate ABC transporter ATP-binding protein [Betaproteobacteria bacterium]